MTPRLDLPPRWIGAGLMLTGALGLLVSLWPPAFLIVLLVAMALAGLVGLLRCAKLPETPLPYEHQDRLESRAKGMASDLRMRDEDAEIAASEPIIDDVFPVRAGISRTFQTKEVIQRTPVVASTAPSADRLPSFRSLTDWEINATRLISPPQFTPIPPVAEQSAAATWSQRPLP